MRVSRNDGICVLMSVRGRVKVTVIEQNADFVHVTISKLTTVLRIGVPEMNWFGKALERTE